MQQVVFRSRQLPGPLERAVRTQLRRAHAARPFSPLDAREAARRAAQICDVVGLRATVYRGGLDLLGVEVDHVWLAVAPTADPADPAEDGPVGRDAPASVVDAAFPLFSAPFVWALRGFVAGDGDAAGLVAAAVDAGVEDRVLGVIPVPARYLGRPVWSAR